MFKAGEAGLFDISFLGALLAGFGAFFTPCILPMVPFYLSYLASTGVNQLAEDAFLPVIHGGDFHG